MPIQRFFLFLFLSMGTHVAIAATDDAVGIVLDLQGSAQIAGKENNGKLQLLSYLKPKMRITLPAGSRASLSLYETRSVYQIIGPTVVDVAKEKLTVVSGAAPVVKSMAAKLVMAAAATDLQAGAYRMRAITPRIVVVTPENGSLLLGAHQATFSWAAMEAGHYDFALFDESEKTLVKTVVTGTSWQLPASIKLDSGSAYHWTVSYKSAKDGKSYLASAEFSLASKHEIDQFAELKPKEDASIEEWILYAAMLQNKRVFYEAQTTWQIIENQRPDLQRAQDLFGK